MQAYGIRHHIDNEPITIGDALYSLSKEHKYKLRIKYDINKIAPNSSKYWNLMHELRDMGIISHIPDNFFGKVITQIEYGTDGFARGAVGYGNGQNSCSGLSDWLNKLINNNRAHYQKVSRLDSLSQEEKLFQVQYISYRNIKKVLEEIFAAEVKRFA